VPEFNVDRIRQLLGEINSSLHKLNGYAELKEIKRLIAEG